MRDKISICMPTYNGSKYIREQLSSILSQLDIQDEIIISDDSSTDDTLQVIRSFQDERIKILEGNKFASPIYNLENALLHSSGEVIFLADQDDVWLDDKVKICMTYLQQFDLVLTDCAVVDEALDVIRPSFFDLNESRKGVIPNLLRNSYLGCCMAFRKKVLLLALPFPPRLPMHDIWLGFIGDAFFRTTLIRQPLLLYRRHDANESSTSNISPYGMLQKLNFRWNILKHIFVLLWRKVRLSLK